MTVSSKVAFAISTVTRDCADGSRVAIVRIGELALFVGSSTGAYCSTIMLHATKGPFK